jgi:DNA-binding LacI/PurR family transcriptional regulator
VQQLAFEMGYSPDAQARSLVMGRTQSIGVVVTTITDPFIAEIVQAVEQTAHDCGYTVILATSSAEPEREIAAVEMLRSKRVDGVIVTSSRVGALYQEHLERLGVPVVLINSHQEHGGAYAFSVSVDNRHGGFLATHHLIDFGHRRIAFVTGPADHSDDLARLAGYRDALKLADLPFDPLLVVPGSGRVDGGEGALARLKSIQDRPTAAFCYNDMTAIGLIHAARRDNLQVPEDLAVVGFDDIPFASYVSPSLTTVAQPVQDMGKRAMEMVLDLLQVSEDTNREISNVLVRGELVMRESTAANRRMLERVQTQISGG